MPIEPADPPPGPDELLAAIRCTGAAAGNDRTGQPEVPAPDVAADRPERPASEVRRVRFTAEGPALIEGPLEVIAPNGDRILADRFLVALCTCKRSGSYPLCDTSHRRRARPDTGREGR
ncbi:CDGSH iron-sulfur domain-containing protein [Nocardia sp. NPDC001965]